MHANQEKQKDLISEKVENYKTEICFFSTSLAIFFLLSSQFLFAFSYSSRLPSDPNIILF